MNGKIMMKVMKLTIFPPKRSSQEEENTYSWNGVRNSKFIFDREKKKLMIY